MKRLSYILSLLVVVSMFLAACAPAATEEAPAATEAAAEATDAPAATEAAPAELSGTLNVWSFTNEIRTMAIAFEGVHPNVDVVYTMIPMTNGEYQTKVKAAAGTADSPDVVALEAAFVKEWVESDLLADQSDLLPLAEELKTFPSVVEVGTYDGITKAYSYQATPGAFFYRRSIAKECLGTDDPDAVQAMVADLDKFVETAAKIKECGTGDYFTVGTSGEMFNPFLANREQPWVVDGELVIDPMVLEYVKFAKLMRENGYESQATQWSEGWFAGMNDTLKDANGTPKKVFSYFLPTWGLPYVLIPNSKSDTTDTGGDWAMINGPMAYQWGGTWVGALEGSPNAELAKEFIKFVALNEDNLTNWATGVYTNEYLKAIDPETPDDQAQAPGDFVSSQVVVEKITSTFDGSDLAKWLGGQNSYAAFAKAAPDVNGALLTGSDDAIQRALNDPLASYLNGDITEAEMYTQWLDAVRNEFPDLVIPEPPVTE
ncbi:MAG TPA: ABC transporter substrate-binding protein [Anaerolineales bacterium]|nr:ABC transporter substrate-binding protein [Anaerolineales bacterium]HNE05221.1 ABC transporter substrate-binding protein [Anaerolineales bacterium]HNF93670.1 ABC transporter substrate-binding protein [Anaerolineales bacterium]HNH25466.1 ABC transporter substrate-binding protein [Anaerolineales bacterium]HNM35583.1 ABC transporter substrate-binding protein [Anaerolineales bacterium]